MASIFTGLAFMHGHIVDRELVMRLGRDETLPAGGTGATAKTAAAAAAATRHAATRIDMPLSPARPVQRDIPAPMTGLVGSPCPTC